MNSVCKAGVMSPNHTSLNDWIDQYSSEPVTKKKKKCHFSDLPFCLLMFGYWKGPLELAFTTNFVASLGFCTSHS